MKRKLFAALIVVAMALTVLPETLRQLHDLRYVAQEWVSAGLWNGLYTDVHAREGAPPAQSASPSSEQNNFQWRGRIAPGRAIEVKGINGPVRAEASQGGEVEVVAVKTARNSDPASVRLQVVEHPGGVTICAVYPDGDPSKPNECKPGNAGHSSVRDNDVKVEFTVRVPAGVRFVGRTVNGRVDATSIGGDVEAYTVNGGIQVSASGLARAKTVNGSINASLGSANWTDKLEFKTVNGSITLDLPSVINTEFQADTVNGEINTDFPLTVQGRFSRRHVQGTIGSGGRELIAQTVNGSIRLRRAQ
ncbi:MAG TPA: DUF4097 family beta strand repeat-containing protein [Pyrinomonadaceae bacterium]|jgi:hypothetical protein